MLGYATVGSNRLADALAFYDALLGEIGIPILFDRGSGGRVYGTFGGTMFGVVEPYDGQPATAGNGSMFGFALDSREAVDRFHARALALGGSDEGRPGPRPPGVDRAYMAYVRDLDGNKLCAFILG